MRSQARRLIPIPAERDAQHETEAGADHPTAITAVLVDGKAVCHAVGVAPRIDIHPVPCECHACQAARVPDAAADYF